MWIDSPLELSSGPAGHEVWTSSGCRQYSSCQGALSACTCTCSFTCISSTATWQPSQVYLTLCCWIFNIRQFYTASLYGIAPAEVADLNHASSDTVKTKVVPIICKTMLCSMCSVCLLGAKQSSSSQGIPPEVCGIAADCYKSTMARASAIKGLRFQA